MMRIKINHNPAYPGESGDDSLMVCHSVHDTEEGETGTVEKLAWAIQEINAGHMDMPFIEVLWK